MRKTRLLGILAGVGLLLTGGLNPAFAMDSRFKLSADLTFASNYMTDGFKIGNGPVFEPSIALGAPFAGVSVLFWSALPMNRVEQKFDEYDFIARYSRDLFAESRMSVNLHAVADYWFYPKTSAFEGIEDQTIVPAEFQAKKGNKLGVGATFPHAFPLAGAFLVPSYDVYYWLYWQHNQKSLYQGGAHHELSLYYGHSVPRFIPGATEQYVGLRTSANYNDGAFGVHPGWSHTDLQLTTGAYVAGCLFSANLTQQWSHQPSDDFQNVLWTSFSVTKEF